MEFKVRGPRASDVLDIRALRQRYHNDGFEFPAGNQIFADAVVEADGKIVAYGVLKVLAEAILIMDHSMPQKVKVQALKELIQAAVQACSERDIKELQAVCQPEFSAVMKKQFGFQKLQGETIVLDI